MRLTEAMLMEWLGTYAWPFLRIGATLMAAPLFGSRALPVRIRLVFALALTLVIAPILPATPPLAFFTAEALVRIVQELLIGFAIGLALQCLFEAMVLGGELLSVSMGLSFAQMTDPLRGAPSPVLAQFLQALAILSFLALGGHLALVEWLVQSFTLRPIAATVAPSGLFWSLVQEGGALFAGGLRVALPGIAALLLVNLAFGVMNRAAPTLNMMSVGFPISLAAGLVVLALSLGSMQAVFTELLTGLGQRLPLWLAHSP